jgi:ABC-type transport system involved in multi-copper enzyme maturation permease subunit
MVQEMEQRTIYIVASKPIHRWEIVLGKYAGLSLTVLVNVALMAVALGLAGWVMEKRVDLGLTPAIVLTAVEILLIVAFALFFSSFASPTVAAAATLMVYAIGHLSGFLRDYVQLYPDKGFHWLFRVIHVLAPDLENLNLKTAVVEHLQLPGHAFGFGLLYGLGYTAVVLFFAALIFERRDLK